MMKYPFCCFIVDDMKKEKHEDILGTRIIDILVTYELVFKDKSKNIVGAFNLEIPTSDYSKKKIHEYLAYAIDHEHGNIFEPFHIEAKFEKCREVIKMREVHTEKDYISSEVAIKNKLRSLFKNKA